MPYKVQLFVLRYSRALAACMKIMHYRHSKQTTFEKMYLLFCVFPSLIVLEKIAVLSCIAEFLNEHGTLVDDLLP